MARRGRGRPAIRDGEKSSSLNVRVANSQFDHMFHFARRLKVTLPEAVRIKLDAQDFTEADFLQLEEAENLRRKALQLLHKAENIQTRITDMLSLLSTARSLSEMHSISKHLLELIPVGRRDDQPS